MKFFQAFHKENNKIDKNNIPKHIAIIMDGNGRWAKKRGLPRNAGHKAGAENLIRIAEECGNLGVKYLTVYAFSTENWKRPQTEVDYLMNLFIEYISVFENDKRSKNVVFKVIGDTSKLNERLKSEIIRIEEKTKNNSGIQLNLALNYGGRNEIINAIKNILTDFKNKSTEEFEINEELVSRYLYTRNMPDPELIIRPSGEQRLSNFLLYQGAYSELWFAKINWPDFGISDLHGAISDYQKRNRRFGGI